jgi:large subunit ribosomal protein L10
MAKLSIECKKLMAEEILNRLGKADSLIVTNYKGLSAQELNELRRELRNISSEYCIIKDSIAKRAIAETQNRKLSEFIKGEVGIALNLKSEPMYIAKAIVKFAKDHEFLKISSGILKGELVSEQDIKTFANLPSREVLLSKLANVLNAPIQGLASSLNGIIVKIAYVFNAVKEKKGQETTNKEQGKIIEAAPAEPQVDKTEEPKN